MPVSEPDAIPSSRRGAGRAAAPKNAKQNASEVHTQQMSTIAMPKNEAFRVPRLSQVVDLKPVATDSCCEVSK